MVTTEFDDAKAAADAVGFKIGGTYKPDGTPMYFLHPPEATDDEVHDMAFQVRHGRSITKYERWGIEVAKRLAGAELEEEVPA